MTELQKKSHRTLELDKVLELLAKEAVCPAAKEMALSLEPCETLYECEKLQQQCEDAMRLAGQFGSPSFSGVKDVSSALERADRGGYLNMRELLDVAALLKTARMTKNYLEKDSQMQTVLDEYFMRLAGNKYLEEKIEMAIVSEEEIADNASPELRDIRRAMRNAAAKIREVLGKIVSSTTNSKALQDSIITTRGDRFVVPVKAEFKGAIPGLIHDVSSSGATIFVEPMQVVELNNTIREQKAKEKNEIDRILAELSSEVAAFASSIASDYEQLCRLDFIFAKAKLAYKMKALRPRLTEKGRTMLKRARHPLLPMDQAVPIEFLIGGKTNAVIITGPNTGGKTVSLKTLGLLTLMSQCGLQIPCGEDSVVCVYPRVLADIGDEQSIEQSLSTFSAHMKNIVEILKEAGEGSLVLMDELGAGTDPVEGAALAVSIIEHLREHGSVVAATTHYAELKTYALETEGVENASCEFDVATLRPTYKLVFGIPGKSNAFAISQRLGLDLSIIDKAKTTMDHQNIQFEDVIRTLEEKRQSMERTLEQAQRDKERAEKDREDARKAYDSIDKDRQALLEAARRQAQELLDDAKRTADNTLEEVRKIRREQEQGAAERNLSEARAVMMGQLSEAQRKVLEKKIQKKATPLPRALQQGDLVEIAENGMQATVAETPKPGERVRLMAGIMKLTAKPEELTLLSAAPPPKKKERGSVKFTPAATGGRASSEVDVRGMTADEAVSEVENFIDLAFRMKLPAVTVIHGKGTGVLRKAVHVCLKGKPYVESFRLGTYGEGESGVTIVTMKLK